MPFGLGFGEMVLIFAVLLLLFGAKRLPEVGGAMGKSFRDFKRGINGLDDGSIHANTLQSPPPAAPAPPPVVTVPPKEDETEPVAE